MKHTIAFLIVAPLLLAACASPKEPKDFVASGLNKNERSLAEASYAVSQSITDLAETEQAANPIPPFARPVAPASYGMAGLTSIDWSGPIEPIVKQIAMAANYRMRVLGTQPAIPVLVTVYSKNMMLGDILRDVAYQAGRRANVVIYPKSKVVELRYAKN